MRSPLAAFLLCCYLSVSQANRVYIHPFNLFASENVSCETLQAQTSKPLETLPVAPLDIQVLAPDSRDPSKLEPQRQNITERTAVLAALLNSLGLRMYQAVSSKQQSTNTLLSPVNTYGSLILLGLGSDKDRKDCVFLMDGHKVLKTLQGINSLVDDGPKDEITTQVWVFTRQDAQLSKDFVRGTQDFSDASFIRGVDFAEPQEAEQLVNSFLEKTSDGRVKGIFKDLNSSSDLLFVSSFNFHGNWRTAFQPEKTSLQEFHVDETTTVMASLMTHTGQYHYLKDEECRCMVVKLCLSKRSYMLLALPDEGASLHDIESKLLTGVMSDWHQNLQEGLLELSLPKFSMSSETSLHNLLTALNPEVEAKLLGSEAEFSQLSNTKPFTIDKDKVQDAGVPLKLSINRPFFFSVIEGDSSAILMLGKITNPTL
ncbi:Angiotensinogen [Liparis tanakae]|uniref:Angiotensinogen n=1 Tax=Liparis tanakae TaxID=230148 RepID=A0A4Z2HBX0_9TELE|nr:Angiotensinogen [Liparis tanakae]